MKRILFLLLFGILVFPAVSQVSISYQGNVTVLGTVMPVPNHMVRVELDTLGVYFSDSTYTDANGHYLDNFYLPPSAPPSGYLKLMTEDCQNDWNIYQIYYGPNHYDLLHDFLICYNPPDSNCHAQFSYLQSPPLTVSFSNTSIGGNNQFLWNFGDGSSSSLMNPVHTYAQPGFYSVSLSIGAPGLPCNDTELETIHVGDSLNTGCHAEFMPFTDSLNPLTVHFMDQSTGNTIQSWFYDFGDGTNLLVTFPLSPNVTHTYAAAGFYNVCLTIQTNDSCSSTQCETVHVGINPQCNANFTWYADSLNVPPGRTYHFIDQSQPAGGITSWQWSFGDGTGSNEQNPIHVFAGNANVYNVCLTISGNNCQDSYCAYVVVGDSIPPCQAYFYENHSGMTYVFNGFINNSQNGVFYWNFGDGATSQGPFVNHTYTTQGIYNVTMTATNLNGCSATYMQQVYAYDSLTYHQIYGQIFAGNLPLTLGMAMIFPADSTPANNGYIGITNVDSLGIYYFPAVPPGNYFVYAIPFAPTGYIPTYYGDVIFWENATVIHTVQLNNPYNIHLVSADSLFFGTGGINGLINVTGLKSTDIDKVTMLLMNSEGKAISYGDVTSGGTFDFSTLAFGTYFLKAELAGISSDVVQVILSEANPTANVTMTFNGTQIQGINDPQPAITAGVVYPNPVQGDAHLLLNTNSSTRVTVSVLGMAGQQVYSSRLSLTAGATTITVPCSGLTPGIYFLNVVSDDGLRINRKLVITR